MKSCPPPDAALRRPAFRLPPQACDAHCHVFGPASIFPYADDTTYIPPDAPKQALSRLHGMLGIERAVIVQASCHGADNSAMLDAIATSEGRYRGVAIVDDGFDDRQASTLHDAGIRGVRFNFVRHLGGVPDMAVFRRTLDRIAPLGWHVVLHLDAGDLIEFGPMLRALTLPFVIDHMGRVNAASGLEQPPFQALLGLMRHENAWVKVCGSERVSAAGTPFTDAAPFAAALVSAAPDRVLWGTDWPHPNITRDMPNDAGLVELIPLFAPSVEQQRKLLVDNPQALYGF